MDNIKAMRIAYSISGYKLPYQFRWLFSAIYDPRDSFAIHVDARTSDLVYREFVAIVGERPNVVFIEREPIVYMGSGLVRSELRAIRTLLAMAPDFDYLVNLSMQDYPLQPRAEIVAALARDLGRNYVRLEPLASLPWRVRVRPYLLALERHGRLVKTPMPRLPPRDLRIRWKGSWWCILSRAFCEWLLSDPKPRRYFDHLARVHAPDELFIQNVLMDSPFAATCVDDNRRLVQWPSRSNGPAVLTMAQWDQIAASPMFYARKFDAAVDREILVRLAKRIGAPVPDLIDQERRVTADEIAKPQHVRTFDEAEDGSFLREV